MRELIIFLTGMSLLLPILGFMAMFACGAIFIWESARPALVQLVRWVRS